VLQVERHRPVVFGPDTEPVGVDDGHGVGAGRGEGLQAGVGPPVVQPRECPNSCAVDTAEAPLSVYYCRWRGGARS
jgi:hypothetical protein